MEQPRAKNGFLAKLVNSRILMQLLRAIHFKDNSTILINSNGLKVTVEDAKSFQVSRNSKLIYSTYFA